MPVEQESQLKQSLRHAYCEQTVAIRQRRRYVEERMLRTRRTWMGYSIPHYIPTDTSVGGYNIPAARRVDERAIVRCVKLLTPAVKWFEVAPMSGSNVPQEKLSNVDSFMWYVMRKKIKSRSNISQLCRCMLLYGFAVLKTSVMVQKGEVWPTQRAVDPFSFYVYPETAPTIEEADDVFEDFLFSFERYQTFVDKGIVDPLNRDEVTTPDWPYHLTERLAYQGLTDPNANVDNRIEEVGNQLKKTTNAFVSLTEKWIRREGELYQVYIAWNLVNGPRIVGFFKSQYDDPLYRMAVHRPLPGETYTTSQADDIDELNNAQQDAFNMFHDAVNREQGFIAFGGSQGMRRDTFTFKGGAKWDFGPENPKETMLFIQPPVTSTNLLRAWQIDNGYMQSMGGAGTIAEGQPGRNMPRSGEAVSSLINLGMADIQDIAEVIEQEILTPGLSDLYKVANMIPDAQLMRIPGGQALYGAQDEIKSNVIRKRDIIGDYEFEWVGSLQFQDEAARAQRLMIFLNMAPTLMPLLQQQGYTLNLPDLIQMIWRSGIGERGLSKVVVTMQEMQAIMQQQAADSGMPIGPQQGPTNLPPEIQAMIDNLKGQAPPSSNSANNTQQNGKGIPGLNLNLPQVTQGFVNRR